MTSDDSSTDNTVRIWDSRYFKNFVFCFEVYTRDKNLLTVKKEKKISLITKHH